MLMTRFLRKLFPDLRTKQPSARGTKRSRPVLEALEDRLALSFAVPTGPLNTSPVDTTGHVVSSTPVNTSGQPVHNTTPVNTYGQPVHNTTPVNTYGQPVTTAVTLSVAGHNPAPIGFQVQNPLAGPGGSVPYSAFNTWEFLAGPGGSVPYSAYNTGESLAGPGGSVPYSANSASGSFAGPGGSVPYVADAVFSSPAFGLSASGFIVG
jgi:hypothetical protein